MEDQPSSENETPDLLGLEDEGEDDEEAGLHPDMLDMDLELAREISREQEREFSHQQHNQHPPRFDDGEYQGSSLREEEPTAITDSTATPTTGRAKRGIPTTLDFNFLRVPGYTPPPSMATITDMELALMFQQEEFRKQFMRQFTDLDDGSELMRNIMMAERADVMRRYQNTGTEGREGRGRDGTRRRRGAEDDESEDEDEDGPTLMDSLSSMGDDMKSKLRNFANKFRQNGASDATATGAREQRRGSFLGRARRSEEERGLLNGGESGV